MLFRPWSRDRTCLHRPLAGAVFAVLSVVATPAGARELHIEHFDARIAVAVPGSIEVTETIDARFVGAWQGLYRMIPIEYRTPQGLNFTLWLDVLRVTDGDGNPLRYESSRERHYRKLKVFLSGAADTRKTVAITYRVGNALGFFDDHDELYWNVTGDEWDVPIEDASAHIVLPVGVTGLRATDFTGGYGSRAQNADLRMVATGVEFHTNTPLRFHEGLTVVVGWDKGFVHEPTRLERAAFALRSNWPLALPVIALGVMLLLWFARGRDPRRRPIAVRYRPPEGLTPGEAGTLLDDSVDLRDISATLVDLAVRGYLAIEQKDSPAVISLFSGHEYVFHLRKQADEWASLKTHERQLLAGVFSKGEKQSVPLSDLENVFYTKLPDIKNSIFESLMRDRFYVHRPDKVRNIYLAVGIVAGVLIVAAGVVAAIKFGISPGPFFIAGLATAVIVGVFARVMPARSERGARALEELRGFEDFLSHVDGDRFKQAIKTPEMFESFLSFAMALGVEKQWAKAFQTIYVRPSNWYLGVQGPDYRVYDFAGNLQRMTRQMGTTLSSSPRSSGSSGFSGGSSGGGSGGGGGGGF